MQNPFIDYIDELYQEYNKEEPETHLDSQGRRVYSKTLLPVETDAPQQLDMRGTF